MVKTQLHWTERIQKFDRRWIFLIMGISIVAPLLYPLNLPIEASEMVKASFYTVENLKEGDTVFLSLDLDPASTPELEPYYRALMLHLKRKKIKIVIATKLMDDRSTKTLLSPFCMHMTSITSPSLACMLQFCILDS